MRFGPKDFLQAFAATVSLVLICLILLKSDLAARQSVTPTNSSHLERQRQPQDAGNGTLGFSSIFFINMKGRYDRLDAASLQAYLSGLELTEYPAVEPEMIQDVGMPPTTSPDSLKVGEKGCWRAHANIWSTMLRKKLPPVLILESDAAWDINIRNIMPNLNRHFRQFLTGINSTRVHSPSAPGLGRDAVDDPWQSGHWDLLSLGQCEESGHGRDVSYVFSDPYVPPGKSYWGRVLGRERMIVRSGFIVCTTAYAISQTGAAKLLLRTAMNLDKPVDLVIGDMTRSGSLVAYSLMPPIMAQWQYAAGIGMGRRGANSDINKADGETEQGPDDDAWRRVEQSGSVWAVKHNPDAAFEEMTLQVAWQRIFGRQ